MGAFEYTALDAQGRERKGLIEGDTPKHVRQLLRDKQLLPMDIQETAQRELKKSRARSAGREISSRTPPGRGASGSASSPIVTRSCARATTAAQYPGQCAMLPTMPSGHCGAPR